MAGNHHLGTAECIKVRPESIQDALKFAHKYIFEAEYSPMHGACVHATCASVCVFVWLCQPWKRMQQYVKK